MNKQYKLYLIDLILIDIASKGLSVTKACEGRLSRETFYNTIENNQELIDKYARSSNLRAEKMADEIIEIADDNTNDTIQTDFGEKFNNEWAQRSRLRVDARKWLLSKMMPKKYGDKLDITSDNKEINALPPIIINGDALKTS